MRVGYWRLKRVLDRHGIALEFHREQERASGFSFSLPLHPDSATQFT